VKGRPIDAIEFESKSHQTFRDLIKQGFEECSTPGRRKFVFEFE
jgi:hypothetical protein